MLQLKFQLLEMLSSTALPGKMRKSDEPFVGTAKILNSGRSRRCRNPKCDAGKGEADMENKEKDNDGCSRKAQTFYGVCEGCSLPG